MKQEILQPRALPDTAAVRAMMEFMIGAMQGYIATFGEQGYFETAVALNTFHAYMLSDIADQAGIDAVSMPDYYAGALQSFKNALDDIEKQRSES